MFKLPKFLRKKEPELQTNPDGTLFGLADELALRYEEEQLLEEQRQKQDDAVKAYWHEIDAIAASNDGSMVESGHAQAIKAFDTYKRTTGDYSGAKLTREW